MRGINEGSGRSPVTRLMGMPHAGEGAETASSWYLELAVGQRMGSADAGAEFIIGPLEELTEIDAVRSVVDHTFLTIVSAGRLWNTWHNGSWRASPSCRQPK